MDSSSIPHVKKFLGKLIVKLLTATLDYREYGVDDNPAFDGIDNIDEYLSKACEVIMKNIDFSDIDEIRQLINNLDNEDKIYEYRRDIEQVIQKAVPLISTLHSDDRDDIETDFYEFIENEYDRLCE